MKNILRQRGIKIPGDNKRPFGETNGTFLGQRRRRENSEQSGAFFGQYFRAFGQNMSVIKLDFNSLITHGITLRRPLTARKPVIQGVDGAIRVIRFRRLTLRSATGMAQRAIPTCVRGCSPYFSSSSAICTAFSAAPLRS